MDSTTALVLFFLNVLCILGNACMVYQGLSREDKIRWHNLVALSACIVGALVTGVRAV